MADGIFVEPEEVEKILRVGVLRGDVMAEAGSEEEVISCTIDLADVAKVRARLNALADVRKELIH